MARTYAPYNPPLTFEYKDLNISYYTGSIKWKFSLVKNYKFIQIELFTKVIVILWNRGKIYL